MGTLAVGTKTLQGIKRVPQRSPIGPTALMTSGRYCTLTLIAMKATPKQNKKHYQTRYYIVCVVCVCVFFPFNLDIKFVARTSRGHSGGRSHMISHPPSFCGACLNFSREKDSAIPFPRRP